MNLAVQDKYGQRIDGVIAEFSPGVPNIIATSVGETTMRNSTAIAKVRSILTEYYAGEIDDVEERLKTAGFVIIHIDFRKNKRRITPHKGGRSVKKSTDVTPEIANMLSELHKNDISLGDIIDEAVKAKFEQVFKEK